MDYATIWAWIVANRRTIITIIIIIIVIILLKRNWYRVRQFVNPQAEDNVPPGLQDESQSDGISVARKIYIESIAADIEDDIDGLAMWGGHDYEPYAKASALYDDELKYLGKYYRDYILKGKGTLSEEIEAEYYWWSSNPSNLATKLKSYGL